MIFRLPPLRDNMRRLNLINIAQVRNCSAHKNLTFFRPKIMPKPQIVYHNVNEPGELIPSPNTNNFNRPYIFIKKQKQDWESKVIPFKVKTSDMGKPRHFPPAAQEWKNSIYSYNINYNKLLPVADKTLMSLVRNYFNFYKKKIKIKIKPQNEKVSCTIRKRSIGKGLSANKIFIAKGNLKHTNSNVLITLYIYNVEKNYLISNLLDEYKSLFLIKKPLIIIKKRNCNKSLKAEHEITTYNRPFTLREHMTIPKHYLDFKILLVEKISKYLSLKSEYFNLISKLISSNVGSALSQDEKLLIFNNRLRINSLYSFKYPNYQYYLNKVKFNKLHILTSFIRLLLLNQVKFKSSFLYKLKYLVSRLYNKNVEFNFVFLKKMHLNSDIYTQAVTLKLRNRDNGLYRVLRRSLIKVDLPNVSRIKIHYGKGKDKLFGLNKLRKLKINSLFSSSSEITNKDYLNKILLYFYPKTTDLKRIKKNRWSIVKFPISLTNHIIRSLKHNKMAGIRVEAKGRLTKRFTASRSVFNLRWKGGLKNIDSSFRGLSAVILRGHVKSNVEYTMLHYKNRNGAFGVKGWVSSK
uniref:Ribosomal protein 3 n=1 Tax=Sarcotrochila macrospora TaxID=132179 RepID=D2E401_9HELO|nr:ribosomal protein 3 [Sarcotrochila macrospora]